MQGTRMLYPSSRRPNSIFRINSSMVICPLIRGSGCTVPLCAMRMVPLRQDTTIHGGIRPCLAATARTRNLTYDDILNPRFRQVPCRPCTRSRRLKCRNLGSRQADPGAAQITSNLAREAAEVWRHLRSVTYHPATAGRGARAYATSLNRRRQLEDAGYSRLRHHRFVLGFRGPCVRTGRSGDLRQHSSPAHAVRHASGSDLRVPTSQQIVGYTRCGDSALWTGAYLAAESFRYKVTQSAGALQNVKSALAGLKALSDLTGDNRLARCMVLASSPYAASIASEEASNTIHQNPPWIWVDNTSRDQVVGAFFGLGVAFDLVDDPAVKTSVNNLVTLLIGYISRHQWPPNDDIASTCEVRPEELQMLLQVARHVNPSNTVSGPFLVPPVATGVEFDVLDLSSYFKFDLDYMSFYQLLRLQDNGDNRSAYMTLRNYTAPHQNAFFNMIDRALRGSDAARDAETRALLDEWLERPTRDFYADLSSKVAVCGSGACQPRSEEDTSELQWRQYLVCRV